MWVEKIFSSTSDRSAIQCLLEFLNQSGLTTISRL
jgi:hypothetical protein